MYDTPLFQYQIKAEPPPSTFPGFALLESTWHQPWSEPVRTRKIAIALIASGLISPPIVPNQIINNFESRWHYAWSEPVRVKPRLHAALNPFVTYTNITPIPNPIFSRWFMNLSEPVRIRPDLKAGLQQFFAMPPRLMPTPGVVARMSAHEINTDIFFAGITVSQAATTAHVSIKEVPAITGAAASIEET